MNKDFNIRLLYFRYKDTPYYAALVIFVVFVISLILFSQLVIPQVQTWFSIRDEILATRQRINTIDQNVAFMSNIDRQELDQQVEIATDALPFEKDFGQILHAITDASANAGVSLDDYFFQVGNIASVSGQQNSLSKNLSTVKLTVSVRGSVDAVGAFLNQINEKIPLSEVTDIDGDLFSTSITIQFYQKQFPKIVFHDDQPLTPLSATQHELLDKLTSWKPVDSEQPGPVSSQSGTTGPVPLF